MRLICSAKWKTFASVLQKNGSTALRTEILAALQGYADLTGGSLSQFGRDLVLSVSFIYSA
jgi:hypothetical protein